MLAWGVEEVKGVEDVGSGNFKEREKADSNDNARAA